MTGKPRCCRLCGEAGHYARTCTRAALVVQGEGGDAAGSAAAAAASPAPRAPPPPARRVHIAEVLLD
jgi:hypothetical protein